MRFDTPIYFQRTTNEVYNADTGNYDMVATAEDKQYACVTNSGVETLKLVYGELKQGSMTIRLQTPYLKPFDRIRIGEKIYRVDMYRLLRTKQTFVVSEVQ